MNNDKILYSKPIVNSLYSDIKKNILSREKKPYLCIIVIDEREDSKIYVNIKKKRCNELGIGCNIITYDNNVLENIIINKIIELNDNDNITGIIIQLPLPKHLNKNNILNKISIKKDIDCLNSYNLGKIINNDEPYFYPCTPLACCKLLEYYNINIEYKTIVFVGTGMVNLPLSIMLLYKKANIILCNEFTNNIKDKTKLADILIVACGKQELIKKDWIKEGVIIIDIGIHKNENNKIIGDVDFNDVIDKVKFITPVPGGIGPLTVCMLLQNCIKI